MKIVIDARLYGLENAGLGRYLINLISELTKIKDPRFSFVIILRKKYFDGLNLPHNFRKVCIDIRHYSFLEQVFLPLFLYRERPDLVHFPHFNVPLFYFGSYVVTIHDMLMHKYKGSSSTTLSPVLYSVKRFFYLIVFKHAVERSKLVFVPTRSVAKELLSNFNLDESKVRVAYEGVSKSFVHKFSSIEKICKEYNLSRKYVMYCGNLYPHKNIDLVLRAIKLLEKKGIKNFDFLIISSRNNFRDEIKLKAGELEIDKRVKFLDFVDDRELSSLMHYSLAYIFPSLSEGFGLPGLEVIASETILLTSDIPVFREVYQDSPLYFDPKNPKDLARVLEQVLEMTGEERKRRVENSKKMLAGYSWEKMAKIVLDSYKEILGVI